VAAINSCSGTSCVPLTPFFSENRSSRFGSGQGPPPTCVQFERSLLNCCKAGSKNQDQFLQLCGILTHFSYTLRHAGTRPASSTAHQKTQELDQWWTLFRRTSWNPQTFGMGANKTTDLSDKMCGTLLNVPRQNTGTE
jgi:hypothetical protein